MKEMVMYQEHSDEYIGNGAIEQEIVIVKEKSDGSGAKLTFCCVIKDKNGKILERGEKVERESDTFEAGIQICKWAKFEEVKEIDRLVNFNNDEWAIIFELENGKSFYFIDNEFNYYISKLYDNADKVTEILYSL